MFQDFKIDSEDVSTIYFNHRVKGVSRSFCIYIRKMTLNRKYVYF